MKNIVTKYIITVILFLYGNSIVLSNQVLAPKSDVGSINVEVLQKIQSGDITPELFEKYAPIMGGKSFWMKVLERFSDDLEYNVPKSEYVLIKDVWEVFVRHNEEKIRKGNRIRGRKDKANEINALIMSFEFPQVLNELILKKIKDFKSEIIVRSGGVREDSFKNNLAGVFLSMRNDKYTDTIKAFHKILEHAIYTIWLGQYAYGAKGLAGVSKIVNPDEGFGFLLQEFLNFKASGTAMTNLFNHVSIEAVIGDAEAAVRLNDANSVKFLFPKKDNKTGKIFDFCPSFIDVPHYFRLNGIPLSADSDRETMKAIIEREFKEKIQGRISPLTESQAQQLFKVVENLEKIVGVPLDVEWGFMPGGELFIVQIRPIIGNFSKNLIRASQNLMNKQKIGSTPVALGQTVKSPLTNESEGFTGRMILYGNQVNQKTVDAVEATLGKNEKYIRVQFDVASRVGFSRNTKAGVLVDPVLCSRQAHNVNLITDRIDKGEFVYANGPVLRSSLSGLFVPHSTFKNVWVSKHDVTYFSDGLKGDFYASEIKSVQMEDNLNPRKTDEVAILTSIHDALNDLWNKEKGDFGNYNRNQVIEVILKDTLFKNTDNHDFFKIVYDTSFHASESRVIDVLKKHQYDKGVYEELQYYVDLLEEILSLPLYPMPWENTWVKILRRILYLKNIDKKLFEESISKQTDSVTGDNVIRVLILEDDDDIREKGLDLLPALINGDMGDVKYFFEGASSYKEANVIMNAKSIDVLIMDISIYFNEGKNNEDEFIKRVEEFTQKRQGLNFLPAMIISAFSEREGKEALKWRGYPETFTKNARAPRLQINTVTDEKVVNWDGVSEFIKLCSKNKKDFIQKEKRQSGEIEKNIYPEGTLKILFFNTEPESRFIASEYLDKSLKETPHKIFIADSFNNACQVMAENDIDIVINDVENKKDGAEGEFISMIERVPFITLFTANKEEFAFKKWKDFVQGKKIEASPKFIQSTEQNSWPKLLYHMEEIYTGYREEISPDNSKGNDKFRMIIVNDETLMRFGYVALIQSKFNLKADSENKTFYYNDNGEFYVVSNFSKALKIIEENPVDYVVMDLNIAGSILDAETFLETINKNKSIPKVDIDTKGGFNQEDLKKYKSIYNQLEIGIMPQDMNLNIAATHIKKIFEDHLAKINGAPKQASSKKARPKKIFVVDDNQLSGENLADIIEDNIGVECISINGIREFNTALESFEPLVVVTKDLFDDKNVYDVMAVILEFGDYQYNPQIIIMSGNPKNRNKENDDHLFEKDKILGIVYDTFNSREIIDLLRKVFPEIEIMGIQDSKLVGESV